MLRHPGNGTSDNCTKRGLIVLIVLYAKRIKWHKYNIFSTVYKKLSTEEVISCFTH